MPRLCTSETWKNLEEHAKDPKLESIELLFKKNPNRSEQFHLKLGGLYLDYSRNQIDDKALNLLLKLGEKAHLKEQITAMFDGKKINVTENKAALHTALRHNKNRLRDNSLSKERELIQKTLEKMQLFCHEFRSEKILGATGKVINTVINIGIGGSDLGPKLVYSTLKKSNDPQVLFASNLDVSDLDSKLQKVDPEKTLFILASKTFTTAETITNANVAVDWLCKKLNINKTKALRHHFLATTANPGIAKEFGIESGNIFEFWDWVGGRYSLWSAVGLPIAMGLGYEEFEALLEGAEEMDLHFENEPSITNMPIMLALVGIWHTTFKDHASHAILPYYERLSLLPDYLQQLEMESNGKMVDRSETAISYQTAPIIWGSCGTDFQHSFAQHLHQSPTVTPCDIIAILKDNKDQKVPKSLLANCLAQMEALAFGSQIRERSEKEMKASRIAEGNRPSNLIMIDRLDAKTLGSLLALYEHKVFVQGVIWNINSFDQWGVELGKSLAKSIENDLEDTSNSSKVVGSTKNIIDRIKMVDNRSSRQ
jgi:glucose-6-phosphate isomerase